MAKKGKPRFIEVNGKRMRLFEWAAVVGIRKSTVRSRLARGWSECDAVMIPNRLPNRNGDRKIHMEHFSAANREARE